MLKNLFFGCSVLFLSFGCKTNLTNDNIEMITVTGVIEQQGITTYQYGTHTLSNEETFYALKSDVVNLDEYLNEEITIIAKKLEGYPVDGGPDFLLVQEVKQ